MSSASADEKEDSTVVYKVFIGNLAPDVTSDAVEDVVKKCGALERIIMKQGFCFCYFKNRDDAQACIDEYDDRECQEITDHRLRVEMARGRERSRFRSDPYNDRLPPNRNLFVVNYEPETTKREDLEKFFQKWGEVLRVQMKEKYCFVEFREVESATTALYESRSTEFRGRILTVEYVQSGPAKVGPRGRREYEYGPPRMERSRGPPPPRYWGRDRQYRDDYYYRYEPYDRYDAYDYYYSYDSRDRYDPRERYSGYAPPVPYPRAPPSYVPSHHRYPPKSPHRYSRSPPPKSKGSPYSRR